MRLRFSVVALSTQLFFSPAWSGQPTSLEPPKLSEYRDQLQGTEHAPSASLDEFFQAARNHSPRILAAQGQLEIAEAQQDSIRGQLLPQVSANATLSENDRDTVAGAEEFDGERYSVSLRQVVYDRSAFQRARQSASLVDQRRLEYESEIATVLSEVASRYFDVLRAQDSLASISAELDALEAQLAQTESMYSRQLVHITDLRQAEARVAFLRAEQIRLEAEVDLRKDALRSLSGLYADSLQTLKADGAPPLVEENLQTLLTLARQQNQRIGAQAAIERAAEIDIAVSKSAYLPRVSLIAQRQDSNVGFDNAPVLQNETTYIGVDVSLPLYSGGARRAAVRRARGALKVAESERAQVVSSVEDRVRAAYRLLSASPQIIAAGVAAVEAANLNTEAMRKGFAFGTVTSIDVLQAIRDQFSAQRDLRNSRYDALQFYLILRREIGALSEDDLAFISAQLTTKPETSLR